jgi:hypothetical protein
MIGLSSDGLRALRAGLLPFTELPYDGGRRLTWCERYHNDLAAPTPYFGGANDRVFSVVTALHDDVRLEQLHQLERSVLVEHYDEVYDFDGGEDVSSLTFASNGPTRALETAHGRVAVDADNERIRALAGGNEKINVTGVQQVEDTVGESDSILPTGSPPLRFRPRCNLRRGDASLQSLLTAVNS